MKYLVCRSLSGSLSFSRFVYLQAGGGEAAKEAEGQKKESEAPMSPDEKREYAKERYEDAKTEMANIEETFGKPDKQGKLQGAVPKEIAQQYEKLAAIVKKYETTKVRSQEIMDETIRVVEGVYAALDEASHTPEIQGVPLDPMAGLAYHPKALREKPMPKVKEAPVAKPEEKKESAEDKAQRVMSDIALRASIGDTNLSADEVATLRKNLKPGELFFLNNPNGQDYDFEMTADKNFVRVHGDIAPAEEGTKVHESFNVVLKLDAAAKGEPKFKFKTKEEIDSAKLEANNKDLDSQLNWLRSDEAPLGSTVLIDTKTVTRKGEGDKEEKVVVAMTVRKGVDGLRLVTFEAPVDDETGKQGHAKEVKSEKYTDETAHALIQVDSNVMSVEGDKEAAREELRFKLDKTSYNLVAHYILGGEGSENFQTDVKEVKKVVTEYNVGHYSYTDHVAGLLVEIKAGNLSILDPSKPNPKYKNPEETPDEQRYAVKSSISLESAA